MRVESFVLFTVKNNTDKYSFSNYMTIVHDYWKEIKFYRPIISSKFSKTYWNIYLKKKVFVFFDQTDIIQK